jgi:hypothetical protein
MNPGDVALVHGPADVFVCARSASRQAGDVHFEQPALAASAASNAVTTDDVQENGASPVYYRVPAGTTRIPFRVVLGAADRPAWTSADPGWVFGLVVAVGIPTNILSSIFSRERSSPLAWIADLGYAYASYSEHLGLLGFGPHIRVFLPTSAPLDTSISDGPLHVSLVPHLALGAREGQFAVGVRTSLALGFSIFGIELAHELTHTSVDDAHAFYFLAGLVGSQEVGGE